MVVDILRELHRPRPFAFPFATLLCYYLAWERHQVEPTAVEIAYLRLIERAPELAKVRDEAAAQ